MKSVILTAILIAATAQISETEKCFLRVFRGSDAESEFDSDEDLIKSLARDFNLLPTEMQNELHKCTKSTFDDGCELKFGKNQCEVFGMVRVKKCDLGYKRADLGFCVQVCPPETKEDAGGALCVKPSIIKRSVYSDETTCLNAHKSCDKVESGYSSGCPENYKQLGRLMCAYECPAGFADTSRHCVPSRQETPEYFLPRFEAPINAVGTADQ